VGIADSCHWVGLWGCVWKGDHSITSSLVAVNVEGFLNGEWAVKFDFILVSLDVSDRYKDRFDVSDRLLDFSNDGVVVLNCITWVLLVGFTVEAVHNSFVVAVCTDDEVWGKDEGEGGKVSLEEAECHV